MSTIMADRSTLKTLALDTSTVRGSVALLQSKEVLAELRLASPETHAARLLRSIEVLLEMAGWELRDVGLVAAGLGPGSFTGIRIGLSTALGLAQTLKIPFAGISGLDALAYQCAGLSGTIGVIMDAQRGQIYFGEYVSNACRVRRVGAPGLYFPADLKAGLVRKKMWLIGDGLQRHGDALGLDSRNSRVVDSQPFVAASIGRLAIERKSSWRTGDYLVCDPLYIRPPDAHKPKSRKN
jgi:tRNA threonylcarbamoyladenosine biosynthesis protein TsaB